MNKSVLVIDTPEACCQCKFSGSDGDYCCVKENLIADGNMILEEEYLNKKPNWCPLIEIPQKYETVSMGYERGYNACIEEMLGDNK